MEVAPHLLRLDLYLVQCLRHMLTYLFILTASPFKLLLAHATMGIIDQFLVIAIDVGFIYKEKNARTT
uniref:Uncharacterized protein n=1 Tax=Arundo donax TaxID=35708 RepID=A0A0A9C4Q8_ARUDO